MIVRTALIGLALALGGCSRQGADEAPGPATQLDTPAPDSMPTTPFNPNNAAARSATGQLTMSVTQRLPDAGSSNTDQQEVLTLRGASGLIVEARVTENMSPATQVQNQTLRALLDMPVEAPQVLVYRVTGTTKPAGVQGLCGAEDAEYIVVWESTVPGSNALRLLGTRGGAPGAASAQACPMLDYSRGE